MVPNIQHSLCCTNFNCREVVELVAGTLPFLHLSTECHCPPSHPLVNPQNPSSCTQHPGGNLIPRGTVGRLNSLSHAAGYLNDFSGLVDWVSSPGVRNVNITINLTNSLYEVKLTFCVPKKDSMVTKQVLYNPVDFSCYNSLRFSSSKSSCAGDLP